MESSRSLEEQDLTQLGESFMVKLELEDFIGKQIPNGSGTMLAQSFLNHPKCRSEALPHLEKFARMPTDHPKYEKIKQALQNRVRQFVVPPEEIDE